MNQIQRIALGLLPFLLLAPTRAAESAPTAAITARAKQTRTRVDVLFRHRNDPPAPLGPNQNPFRTSIDLPVTTAPLGQTGQPADIAQPLPPTSDDILLKQAVASLKISGTVVIRGQINVSINQAPYQEGSIITAKGAQGKPVYLRIRHITSGSVTFALNDSEVTQSF